MIGGAKLYDRAPQDLAGLLGVFRVGVANIHARIQHREGQPGKGDRVKLYGGASDPAANVGRRAGAVGDRALQRERTLTPIPPAFVRRASLSPRSLAMSVGLQSIAASGGGSMAWMLTRRAALKAAGAGALVAFAMRPFDALADDAVETHGLSSFGDLALPPDFAHFTYVNPDAPTGGLLSLQITGTSGNQNFDTFDTLNIYSWKGDGAAGMGATFDTLMTANGDEPDSVYGLLAQSVRVSGDKLDYRFRLRPEAKFFDGSRVTAADVAFSLNILKDKGHPVYAQLLREVESAAPEGDDVVHVRFVKDRSRDAHLIVVGMPVFSAAWWKGRDFTAATLDAPLGSGAYKVKTFEQGRFIEYERRPDYWGAKLPVNLGQNNFDRLRFEYYRERQVAFEAFKAGAINYHEEYTSRFWATAYDFPAAKDGRVKKETLHNGEPSRTQGWYLNTRSDQFKDPRVREAIGLAFDFEWTNKNIMYSAYKRVVSFFPNTEMEAKGKPGPDELKLLEPFRDKVSPAVFDEPYTSRRRAMAPASTASCSSRPTISSSRPAASATAMS